MNSGAKSFDAVATVREIRDRITTQIVGMTLEEQLEWMAAQDLGDPFLDRLRNKAAQQGHHQPDLRTAADGRR
jgi:hypothetical protein